MFRGHFPVSANIRPGVGRIPPKLVNIGHVVPKLVKVGSNPAKIGEQMANLDRNFGGRRDNLDNCWTSVGARWDRWGPISGVRCGQIARCPLGSVFTGMGTC